MQIGTAFVFLLMLGAALAFVGWPLASPARTEDEPTARQRRREELQEKKERLLAALRDLDLDHRTGKTDDDDNAALSAKLKREAAETMKELDALEGEAPVRKPGVLEPATMLKVQAILQRSIDLAARPQVRVDGEIARRVRAALDKAMRPLPSDPVALAALSREIDDLYLRYASEPLTGEPTVPVAKPTDAQAKALFDSLTGDPAVQQAVSALRNAPPAAGARFCTKCGWKAKAADDRFCGRCGAELPTG